MSSSRREPADLAALYSRKAGNDATAAREFAGNLEISDEIIGFHAQQAVEKWLKALMANLGLPQQRTHDIDQLGRVLEEQGVDLPVPRSRLAELTDFAVPCDTRTYLTPSPSTGVRRSNWSMKSANGPPATLLRTSEPERLTAKIVVRNAGRLEPGALNLHL